MKRVLVTEEIHPNGMAILEKAPGVEIVRIDDIEPKTLRAAVQDVDGIVVRTAMFPRVFQPRSDMKRRVLKVKQCLSRFRKSRRGISKSRTRSFVTIGRRLGVQGVGPFGTGKLSSLTTVHVVSVLEKL